MLTFLLRYNFSPLTMHITSWIDKGKSAHAEKIVRKIVEIQETFLFASCFSLYKSLIFDK